MTVACRRVLGIIRGDYCGALPNPEIKRSDPLVAPGSTITGNAACWAVPTSAAGSLAMIYQSPDTDQRVWFALR